MSPSRTGLAVIAGLAGLVLWRNASDDTKQSVINFLSQIPAAIDEAERRRALAENQSRYSPVLSVSLPNLLDDRAIAEILAELNQKQPLRVLSELSVGAE